MSSSQFTRYVGIDWSGAKTPRRSYAVSLAHCLAEDNHCPLPLKEKLSRTQVYEWIANQLEIGERTLVGIDCNLGLAQSMVEKHLGTGTDYQALWAFVEVACAQESNFFAGQVWQTSALKSAYWTQGKQPDWFDLNTLRRRTEHAAIAQACGTPESPFKLIGAKQVGKGGLAGMRMVHKLKKVYGDKLAVWPFESHLADRATVVISENFPRVFIRRAGLGNQKIRNLGDLNEVLAFYESAPFVSASPLNDHLTDAMIAAAGMRWVHANENPLDASNLPIQSIEIEGWIYAVQASCCGSV